MTAPGERRLGRIAGLAALASVASWLGALQFANAHTGAGSPIVPGAAVGQPAPIDRARELLDFHAGVTDQALATTLRCVGLMLTAAVGIYVYSLVRTRRPDLSRWMLWSALIGATQVKGGYHTRAAQEYALPVFVERLEQGLYPLAPRSMLSCGEQQ